MRLAVPAALHEADEGRVGVRGDAGGTLAVGCHDGAHLVQRKGEQGFSG